jgi:hypothetical protein
MPILSSGPTNMCTVKIKGNRAGLKESTEWFSENFQLTKHVRHIEVWVPVWADKPPDHQAPRLLEASVSGVPTSLDRSNQTNNLIRQVTGNDLDQYPSFAYHFSSGSTSATLSEIFSHVACFFTLAQIFTLEGGHCKKSNMIRQFPDALFPIPDRRLDVLPNVRTFAMRGAWNIMRLYDHWKVMESALPAMQEWHCSYAKPRPEAFATINSILSHLPTKIKHINLSLDGFYCKEGMDGTGMLASSPLTKPTSHHHLCERLGRIAPQVESLSFTGRICDCFFKTATEVARARKEVSQLRAVDIVVKSCCRLVVVKGAPGEDEREVDRDEAEEGEGDNLAEMPAVSFGSTTAATNNFIHPSTTMSPYTYRHHQISTITGSITHLPFILSFERLILSAVKSLDYASLPCLSHIRIRFIDLDSACPLLNPYFVFDGARDGWCSGVWNEEILAALAVSRPESVGWQGVGEEGVGREDEDGDEEERRAAGSKAVGLRGHLGGEGVGSGLLRRKPRAIRSSAYRILADAR